MSTRLYLHFPQTNLQYEILPGQEVIVGRTSACDVDLTHYMAAQLKTVSRQHFKVNYSKGEGFFIVDMSHNGTQVNSASLTASERRILRHADIIKLANNPDFLIEVIIESDPDATDTIDDPTSLFSKTASETELTLYFDQAKSQFVVDETLIPHEHLTKLEVQLLKYLCDNRGRLCSFDTISIYVWGDPAWLPENNTISRAVGNLRKKLDQVSPGAGKYIQNIRGQGYKVDV